MTEFPSSSGNKTPQRQEFDRLFFELTGLDSDSTEKNEEGWLFVPLDGFKKDATPEKHAALMATGAAWKHRMVPNDNRAGRWISRPTASEHQQEFNTLITELTGIDITAAEKNVQGHPIIPFDIPIRQDLPKQRRLMQLNGVQWGDQRTQEDPILGFWFKPPA